MDTPKKLKRWQDRTSSASRTRGGRKYHGPKNVRLAHNIGENMSSGFKMTMLPGTVLGEIFTKQDAMLPYMPVKVGADDLAVQAAVREEYSRKDWRDRMRPWRRRAA